MPRTEAGLRAVNRGWSVRTVDAIEAEAATLDEARLARALRTIPQLTSVRVGNMSMTMDASPERIAAAIAAAYRLDVSEENGDA
jgi:hypothetical protein